MNGCNRDAPMRTAASLVVLCLAIGMSGAHQSVWGDDRRVVPVFGLAVASQNPNEGATRTRTTVADIVQLEAARARVVEAGEATVLMNLFDDVELEAVFTRSTPTATGFALSGRLTAHGANAITLVVNQHVLAGTVLTPRVSYRIGGTAQRTFIREMESGIRCHLQSAPMHGSTRPIEQPIVASLHDEESDDEAVIDLLVVYPSAARRLEGGHLAMRALIDHDVAATNDSYRVSGANQRIELVAAVEVDYRPPGTFAALAELENVTGSLRETVDELVANYQADIFFLHMGPGNAGAAYGFNDPTPEEIARRPFAVGYSGAFAHEIGHIMGLKHEWAHQPSNKPFPYSHGYVFPDPSDPQKSLCTIMAAFGPCLPRFSNPEQKYPDENGVPLGVPGEEPSTGVEGPADAVRHLNELRHDIAAIRPRSEACTYELSSSAIDVPVAGGSYTLGVETAADCEWTVRGLDPAVSVPEPAKGTGSAEVRFEVAENLDWERDLGLAVAGEVLVLRQAAARQMKAVCERSAAARSALERAVGKGCGDIGTDDLVRIDELDIGPREITLRAGDFDGLSGLASLEIFAYWTSPYVGPTIDIDRRMFAGLSNLTVLRFEGVDLALAPDVFEDLVNLEKLVIIEAVDSIPAGIFAGLQRLDTLMLGRNGITGIRPGVFEGLTNLRKLSMRFNEGLTTLLPGVLSALTSLERLDLRNNDLRTLPLGVFDGLPRLESLLLADNSLSKLEVGLFDGLPSLDYLWLSDNLLTDLKPGVFRDLPRLRVILLDGNRLTALTTGVFDGLRQLTTLNLRANRLRELEEGIFEHCCGVLLYLSLNYNELTALPADIHGLDLLKFLDVSYNRIVGISADDFTWVRDDVLLEQRTRTRTTIPLFARADDPIRQSFLRVINYFPTAGDVEITAIDDAGTRFGPLTLEVGASAVSHVNSDDLEAGNASKGLSAGTGPGSGEWRLQIETDLDAESLAYNRTGDGFVASAHDLVSAAGREHEVAMFNPAASEDMQASRLRVMNMDAEDTTVRITAIDDAGNPGDGPVTFPLPAQGARSFSASELESGGSGFEGSLGDGEGRWRLRVESDRDTTVMNLLETPEGYVSNLSTVAGFREDGVFVVPLFPAAGGQYEGLVRVVNDDNAAGTVRMAVSDQSSWDYEAVELEIGANEAVDFDSDDLEIGNVHKGLSTGTGAGEGDWRLELKSGNSLRVSAYIRTADGFLSSMHDLVPEMAAPHHRLFPPQDLGYRVVTLNPGRNANQFGFLRIANPGSEAVRLGYRAYDDVGESLRPVRGVGDLEPGRMRILTSVHLEEYLFGGHYGSGKWQIQVDAEHPIEVMSLLRSPTGHLVNLSSGTRERREAVRYATEDQEAAQL